VGVFERSGINRAFSLRARPRRVMMGKRPLVRVIIWARWAEHYRSGPPIAAPKRADHSTMILTRSPAFNGSSGSMPFNTWNRST
jgi:hypothetical protein